MDFPTYHLWVKPSGAIRDALARTIRELAYELGGPMFEPHVTLLGDLIGTEEEHAQRSRIAAQQLRPFNIILSEASYRTQYFQCLFMGVEQTASLMRAHAVARRIFQKPDETYMPHLSLVYGSRPESQKKTIIQTLPFNLRTSFEVVALSLVRADSSNPKDWHEIALYPFTG
jgi:2'-5' RNA ligase